MTEEQYWAAGKIIDRIHGYEKYFEILDNPVSSDNVPFAIKQQLKNWVEGQIIIEKANLNCLGNEH